MASPLMKEQLSNRETAVREVIRGYDLTTQLQSLLKLRPHGDPRTELAGSLLEEVLQALSASLSILNSGCRGAKICGSPDSASDYSITQRSEVSGKKPKPRLKNQGRKRDKNSWTRVTSAPFADGHQWRKYGEKKIQNFKYPRCYYRCTHKDVHECPATKQVEQRDNEDPPMYLVTYNMQHTCKGKLLTPDQFTLNSPPSKSSSLGFKLNTLEYKQENLPLSPALSKISENCGQMVDWQKSTCSTSNHPIMLDVMEIQEPFSTDEFNNCDLSNKSLTSSLQEWDMDSLIADY